MSTFSPEAVQEFLIGLGGSADEVAESLRTLGIKGRPGAAASCPIARALKAQFPDSTWFGVGPDYWVWACTDAAGNYHQDSLPEAVQAFIGAFDKLHYPELIER